MGTPRPHVSRHVSGRAPRRGRRPRRPVFRSPIAGCTRVLHVCLRRPYFFQQRKKYGKERRQKPSVFGFPFRPIVTAVQKGSAPDRLHSYLRCRSCVPRENFLLSRRTEEVLYILHTFIFCGPTARFPFSDCGLHPRPAFMPPVAIFLSTAKEIWKRTPPKTHGLWISFRPIVTAVQKGPAPDRLHSYPRCRSCVPRENFLLSRRTGEVPYILHTFIFCGPKGRTYTCRRRRQVRDLIIVLNGRPASPPPTTSAAERVDPWPISCGTFSIRTEIGLKKIQKPSVFGGAFAHFCRCWQKRVAPESEMSPPRASAQNDTPPAEPEGYRSSHDLKTCPC